MRYILTVITLLLSSLLDLAIAQGIVNGKVFDNITHEPLHGVYVIYHKSLGTTTDENGNFTIKTDSARFNIAFQFIGYKSDKRTVKIRSNDTIELNVGLVMEIQEIGQIVVSANKSEQKVAELTVSMDIIKSVDFLKTHITDAQ